MQKVQERVYYVQKTHINKSAKPELNRPSAKRQMVARQRCSMLDMAMDRPQKGPANYTGISIMPG